MSLFVNKKPKPKLFKASNFKVWTTSRDQKIAIVDMADTHLMNTIKMLRRGRDASGVDVSNRVKYLPSLENEANKRGLIF